MSDADYSTGVPECEEAACRGNSRRHRPTLDEDGSCVGAMRVAILNRHHVKYFEEWYL